MKEKCLHRTKLQVLAQLSLAIAPYTSAAIASTGKSEEEYLRMSVQFYTVVRRMTNTHLVEISLSRGGG